MVKLNVFLTFATFACLVILSVNAKPYSSECRPCRIPIYLEYVCGTDGKTYFNEEHLYCENRYKDNPARVYHINRCVVDKFLSCAGCAAHNRDYDPHCGSDGLTYDNLSLLECAQKCRDPNIIIAHRGPCRDDPEFDTNKRTLFGPEFPQKYNK